jgi:hypothetical protein
VPLDSKSQLANKHRAASKQTSSAGSQPASQGQQTAAAIGRTSFCGPIPTSTTVPPLRSFAMQLSVEDTTPVLRRAAAAPPPPHTHTHMHMGIVRFICAVGRCAPHVTWHHPSLRGSAGQSAHGREEPITSRQRGRALCHVSQRLFIWGRGGARWVLFCHQSMATS